MIIKSINKKKHHSKMKNKRGLFLLSVVEKVYEKILKKRNEKKMNEKKMNKRGQRDANRWKKKVVQP